VFFRLWLLIFLAHFRIPNRFVTDFAPYKPTYIPDYNPADFSYFFDTSGRRSCYIAPERFQKAVLPHTPTNVTEGADAEAAPTPQPPTPPTPTGLADDSQIESLMDIFSLGCVIAELWLEGTPLFNLSELLSYRNVSDSNRFNPATRLAKIDNEHVRRLILHMIQLNPDDRHSAGQYLKMWTSSLFPSYFHDLHTYMANLMDLEADDRVKILAHDFDILFAKFRVSSTTAASGGASAAGGGLTSTPGVLVRSNTATSAEMLRTLAEPMKLNTEDTIRAEELEARRLSAVATAPSFHAAMAEKAATSDESTGSYQIDSRTVKAQLVDTQQLILDLEALKSSEASSNDRQIAAGDVDDKKLLQSLDEEDQSITVSDDPNQSEAGLRKALAYYKQKVVEAKKSDDKSGLISAYESLSSVSRGLADFDRSRKYNTKLRDIAKQMSSFAALQRAFTLSGVTEFETGDLDSACKYFEEAFRLAQDLDDRLAQCQLAARLAEVYTSFKMFDRVTHYQQLYDSLVQEIGASRVLASSLITNSGNTRPPKGTGNAISFHSKPARTFKSLTAAETPQAPGFVIVLSLICSLLRNLRDQQTRLLALDTLNRMAPHVEDDIRLQRIVPYVVSLLDADTRNAKSASLVTAHAIKTLTNVIGLVRNFPPSDARMCFSLFLQPHPPKL
jgi:tetratricopeptide (TPR) repeat protein